MKHQNKLAFSQLAALTNAQLAKLYGVSIRMLERAIRVHRHGVPELVAMLDRGDLKLGPAETIANLPRDQQRAIVAQGAEACRQLNLGSNQHEGASQEAPSQAKAAEQMDVSRSYQGKLAHRGAYPSSCLTAVGSNFSASPTSRGVKPLGSSDSFRNLVSDNP